MHDTLRHVSGHCFLFSYLYIFECNRYCCQLPADCFVRSMKLRVADKCVFELVQLQKTILYTFLYFIYQILLCITVKTNLQITVSPGTILKKHNYGKHKSRPSLSFRPFL